MKYVILGLILVSSNAQASWFQDYCSNAEGTVRIAQGHNENEIKVTASKILKDGTVQRQPVILEDAFVTPIEVKELETESNQTCTSQWGSSTWRNLRYQIIRIERPEGPVFSQDIIGVSADGRSIEAKVICEEKGNSEIFCAQPANAEAVEQLKILPIKE